MADFDRDVYYRGGKFEERFDFFMAVFVIGWVVVLFVFFVFLLSFEGKITTEKNWNIIVSILLYQCTLILRLYLVVKAGRGGEGRVKLLSVLWSMAEHENQTVTD